MVSFSWLSFFFYLFCYWHQNINRFHQQIVIEILVVALQEIHVHIVGFKGIDVCVHQLNLQVFISIFTFLENGSFGDVCRLPAALLKFVLHIIIILNDISYVNQSPLEWLYFAIDSFIQGDSDEMVSIIISFMENMEQEESTVCCSIGKNDRRVLYIIEAFQILKLLYIFSGNKLKLFLLLFLY